MLGLVARGYVVGWFCVRLTDLLVLLFDFVGWWLMLVWLLYVYLLVLFGCCWFYVLWWADWLWMLVARSGCAC